MDSGQADVNYGTSYVQTHKFYITRLLSTSEEMVAEARKGSKEFVNQAAESLSITWQRTCL